MVRGRRRLNADALKAELLEPRPMDRRGRPIVNPGEWRPDFGVGRDAAAANTPDQPILNDDLAPALNCQDNLFDGCQLTIGGFSLGSRTKLAPQISAVNKRLMKSAGWLNGVGKSAHTWEARLCLLRLCLSSHAPASPSPTLCKR